MGKDSFQEIEAVTLFCPTCGRPVRVTKILLLVLPGGDKYQYRCSDCGEVLGTKMDRSENVRF